MKNEKLIQSDFKIWPGGAFLLFYSTVHCDSERQQSLLQQILRQRATVFPCRRKVRTVPEKGHPKMDEVSIFPVWIFNLFLCDVFPYAVEKRRWTGKRSLVYF